MPELLDSSTYWLDRAEQARAAAEAMRDEEARRLMLSVAKTYVRLAAHAEEQGRKDKS
jgi:hypothetical protein